MLMFSFLRVTLGRNVSSIYQKKGREEKGNGQARLYLAKFLNF
jgi:hypothetical protein